MPAPIQPSKPWRDFNSWLKQRFGQRVQKVCIDAGFTCPNRDGLKGTGGCAFCDSVGSGARHVLSSEEIGAQVRRQIGAAHHRYGATKFIAYFQAFTNTYAPAPTLRATYDSALVDDRIIGLSVGTRSDCVTEEICEILATYRTRGLEVWLELGLQTANPNTLARMNCLHTPEDFARACELARAAGLNVVAHIIIGLPGEKHDDFMTTVRLVNRCQVGGVKIHNLFIDSRSNLAEPWRRGEIHMLSREDYISAVCDALELLNPETLVHRLTGEAPPEFLLAPEWVLDKYLVINAIERELHYRGTAQGSRALT